MGTGTGMCMGRAVLSSHLPSAVTGTSYTLHRDPGLNRAVQTKVSIPWSWQKVSDVTHFSMTSIPTKESCPSPFLWEGREAGAEGTAPPLPTPPLPG